MRINQIKRVARNAYMFYGFNHGMPFSNGDKPVAKAKIRDILNHLSFRLNQTPQEILACLDKHALISMQSGHTINLNKDKK